MFTYRKYVILFFQNILFIIFLNSCDPGLAYTINGKEDFKIKTDCDSVKVVLLNVIYQHALILRSNNIKSLEINTDSISISYNNKVYYKKEVIDQDDFKIIKFNDQHGEYTTKNVKIHINGFIRCNGKVIFPDTLVAEAKEL
jgi:hypothetical protein